MVLSDTTATQLQPCTPLTQGVWPSPIKPSDHKPLMRRPNLVLHPFDGCSPLHIHCNRAFLYSTLNATSVHFYSRPEFHIMALINSSA